MVQNAICQIENPTLKFEPAIAIKQIKYYRANPLSIRI